MKCDPMIKEEMSLNANDVGQKKTYPLWSGSEVSDDALVLLPQ